MDEAITSLIYRPFDIEHDFIALARLLRDVEQIDRTGEEVTEAALNERLTWSGQDPALNNWVVAQPNSTTLVAYGFMQKMPNDDNADLHLAVHPAWRRQGIGSHLLTYLLEHAYDRDTEAVRAYVDTSNEGASLFVQAHGFEPASTYTRLSVSGMHSFPVPMPLLPTGFTIRSYDQIRNVELYTEAINRCYEDMWGHLQCTQQEIARWLPQLNHAGIFLLFAPGETTIVGTCRADLNEHLSATRGAPTALINAPGIIPEYRNTNIFFPLLLTAIHWLLPQKPVTLELESWGDAPIIISRYQSLGFCVIKEEISYRLTKEHIH